MTNARLWLYAFVRICTLLNRDNNTKRHTNVTHRHTPLAFFIFLANIHSPSFFLRLQPQNRKTARARRLGRKVDADDRLTHAFAPSRKSTPIMPYSSTASLLLALILLSLTVGCLCSDESKKPSDRAAVDHSCRIDDTGGATHYEHHLLWRTLACLQSSCVPRTWSIYKKQLAFESKGDPISSKACQTFEELFYAAGDDDVEFSIERVSSTAPGELLVQWNVTWIPTSAAWLQTLGQVWPGIEVSPATYNQLSGQYVLLGERLATLLYSCQDWETQSTIGLHTRILAIENRQWSPKIHCGKFS